jgi:S-(hydroxymethyl)glutathione dehydrogenase / alcohol dehydrogenase
MLRPGGTATIVGLLPQNEKISINSTALVFDRRLQGSSMGSNRFRIDIPRYLAMYRDGRLKLDDLVTKHVALDEVDDSLVALSAGDGIKRTIAVIS